MNILGKTIQLPIAVDIRGAIGVIDSDDELITQGIIDLIETRQGERKMLPNYGLPDFLFDPLDSGFAVRLAFYIEEQALNYFSSIETISAEAGSFSSDDFVPHVMPAAHTAGVRIRWTRRGHAVPQELIYPTWRLTEQ